MLVRDFTVENGILYPFLYYPDLAAFPKAESLHNFNTVDRGLEIPDTVTLLQFHHLLPHKVVVRLVTLHLVAVFRCNISRA